MNIKSLLLGSAAALAAVSGAHAADAIVAAEPEAMEYVRVCDAFGKGYFYIPGTETCLSIGGYIRTQVAYAKDNSGTKDWDTLSRGYLTFAAKNDTEIGTVTGYINLETNDDGNSHLDGAWINVAGFDVGYFYDWWDDGIAGETDDLGSNLTNAIRYTYENGGLVAGLAVEEVTTSLVKSNDDVGVSGKLGYTVGGISANVIGSYDFRAKESAFRGIATAVIGPGTLAVAGIYATGSSFYYSTSKWVVAASYELKATDKLTITPGFQYNGEVNFISDIDSWTAGLTAGYQITDGLKSLATINYKDQDKTDATWSGFVRLQRDF